MIMISYVHKNKHYMATEMDGKANHGHNAWGNFWSRIKQLIAQVGGATMRQVTTQPHHARKLLCWYTQHHQAPHFLAHKFFLIKK